MSIPNVTDCRYLGITISVKNCDLDLKRQKRRFYANTRELLRKYVYNFRNRLETGDNVIIRGIYLSHITFQSGIWDWRRDILSP